LPGSGARGAALKLNHERIGDLPATQHQNARDAARAGRQGRCEKKKRS